MCQSSDKKDILDSSVRDFIAATAAKSPTPGGGSVAALAGALAASLAQMSLEYTVGKKQFEQHRQEISAAIDKLRKAAGLMQDLVFEDMTAYRMLSDFLKMPAEVRTIDPDYLPAVVASIRAPQSVGGVAIHILELCLELIPRCNPALLSDLGNAAALARATVEMAEINVLVNLRFLPNEDESQEMRKRAHDMTVRADILLHKVRDSVLPQL